MKNLLQKLFVIFLLVLTGCSQESSALEAEYEFLTPQVVVLKSARLPEFSDAEKNLISRSGNWFKENALLRNKQGEPMRKADVTCFSYLIFKTPPICNFSPGFSGVLKIR